MRQLAALIALSMSACVVPSVPDRIEHETVIFDAGRPDSGTPDTGQMDAGSTDADYCIPENEQTTCLRLDLPCGVVDVVNNCGVSVQTQCACSDGGLSACPSSDQLCDGGCVALDDFDNCGACGNACLDGGYCDNAPRGPVCAY